MVTEFGFGSLKFIKPLILKNWSDSAMRRQSLIFVLKQSMHEINVIFMTYSQSVWTTEYSYRGINVQYFTDLLCFSKFDKCDVKSHLR